MTVQYDSLLLSVSVSADPPRLAADVKVSHRIGNIQQMLFNTLNEISTSSSRVRVHFHI